MKQTAIEKGQNRLAKAQECLTRIERAKNFPDFESAWSDFLLALNTIHTALEQGAKDDAKSNQWYGGKKKERRNDPLLRYLHHARNADEHGLLPVAEHKSGNLAINSPGEPNEFFPSGGSPFPAIKITPPHVVLITVIDERYHDKFDPPIEHLGIPLSNTSPFSVRPESY
jgi:hypothetical protein